ncbi:YfhH family protein [Bacillus massilinigeriensis]|uniref:YfhH family protein n=1 Tax=Bacillus mediterraneensis TaxID=1805474 RepID=UPI0008F8BB3B|nr:YfhH family protein [Bacillus mediterraneensis]
MSHEKRYSQYTEYELQQEIATLREKARKAEQMGMVNELAVLERKAAMAKAYLLNPEDFKPGELFEIEGDPGAYFKIDYINGVFAWGYRLGGAREEEALPISLLKKLAPDQE